MSKSLSEIIVGEKVTVEHITHPYLNTKLIEMGMHAGLKLELLYKAPFGDPIAISMNGSILTLRLDEAKYIQVCSSPV
jgi:Fe2+ transport system protein FeoA